ncbi:hypothetical protein [Micromonospora sp. NPDC047527]|uniref:hypothetical protein n=1 Tax=unclassified Micromonospora TaxID=2617518 RepID=UPI0033E1FC68
MRTFRLAVPALVVCAVLSACGGTADPASPGTPSTATAEPTSAAPTPPSPTLKSPGGPSVPPPVGATELTGTVTPGVEPNCLLLDGYLLIGGPRDVLTSGARVTVTGRVEAGLMTTCQQGTPFVVEGAHRS